MRSVVSAVRMSVNQHEVQGVQNMKGRKDRHLVVVDNLKPARVLDPWFPINLDWICCGHEHFDRLALPKPSCT